MQWRKPFSTSGCLTPNFSLNLSELWLPKSVKEDYVSHFAGLVMMRKIILKCFVNCKVQQKYEVLCYSSLLLPSIPRTMFLGEPETICRVMHSQLSTSKIIMKETFNGRGGGSESFSK